jgi:autophagy-related protein 101
MQGTQARERAAHLPKTAAAAAAVSPTDVTPSGRGQIVVSFFEKKRKKTYFFGKADENVCWEAWTLDVTCATPKTESGMCLLLCCLSKGRMMTPCADNRRIEAYKVRRAMEKSLQKTALKIVNIANRDKDHIPPITTTDTNPFPYEITVNPKSEAIGPRMSLF